MYVYVLLLLLWWWWFQVDWRYPPADHSDFAFDPNASIFAVAPVSQVAHFAEQKQHSAQEEDAGTKGSDEGDTATATTIDHIVHTSVINRQADMPAIFVTSLTFRRRDLMTHDPGCDSESSSEGEDEEDLDNPTPDANANAHANASANANANANASASAGAGVGVGKKVRMHRHWRKKNLDVVSSVAIFSQWGFLPVFQSILKFALRNLGTPAFQMERFFAELVGTCLPPPYLAADAACPSLQLSLRGDRLYSIAECRQLQGAVPCHLPILPPMHPATCGLGDIECVRTLLRLLGPATIVKCLGCVLRCPF